MPTTLTGLVIAGLVLLPGFIHYSQRRARVQTRDSTPIVEAVALSAVSILTTGAALAVFGLFRLTWPDHAPEPRRMAIDGLAYVAPRFGYIALWATAVLALACVLAVLLGANVKVVRWIANRLTPRIIEDESAWFHVFESGPSESLVYVGCDMTDGAYVSGYLDWYSTELDETGDRDFALAGPITYRPVGSPRTEVLTGFERMVLSARDVARLYVSYVNQGRQAA